MIALALFIAAQTAPPASWVCDPVRFVDGICDCGCGALDDDCSPSIACERVGCVEGTTLDENGVTCSLDDPPDDPPEAPAGCGGAATGVGALLFPLVLCRRRR